MDETRQTTGMREVIRLAEKLNVADVLAPVGAELAKIDMIDRHVAEAVKVGRDAYTRATAALVAGTAPDPRDLAAVLTLMPFAQPTGPTGPYPPALAGIKTHARSAVHSAAWALGLGLVDELHARLVEMAKSAVTAASKAKLPADTTDENTLFRDPTIAAAYARVTQACAVFWDAHRMGDLLRRVQWLPALDDVPGPYIVYKHPDKRLTGWEYTPNALGEPGGAVLLTAAETDNVMASPASQRQRLAGPLAFWHAIRVGAEPGLYDIADAGKRYLAYVTPRGAKQDVDRIRQALSRHG